MAVFTHIETDTGTNVDISAATAVGAYTANGDKLIMVDVSIDAVAGNGDYVMYVTRQIGGSGSAYRILPQTTMAAASGLTAISAQSGWITVRNGDVLTVYVDGLAGDTATPDWTTRWYELAGVTAAAVADAVLDEATSGHTSAGSFSKAVTDILADTGTDGVVVGSMKADAINAGAVKADAVTKIQNGLATALALDAVDNFIDTEITTIINHLTDIKGVGWTNETLVALKAYVDELETRLTAARAGYLDKLNVPGTLANSNDANTYKADVSGLATQESVNAIPTTPLLAANYTAPDNAGIGAIKTKTDQLTFTTLNKVDASATIDPTGIATEAHLQEVEDKVDKIEAKTDLLDFSKVNVVTPVNGSTITILRGDTLDDGSLTDLGDLSNYVSIDFTVKSSYSDTDDEAIIRIRKNASGVSDGLLRLNGAAAPSAALGSITIDDLVSGDITIILAETATDDLVCGDYVYDLQVIKADSVKTKTCGKLSIVADITRAVS